MVASEIDDTSDPRQKAGDGKETAPQSARRNPRGGSAIRWLVVLSVVGVCAWLAHAVILRGFAALLVADQLPPQYDWVWIVDGPRSGDKRYDEANKAYRQDRSRRILLIEQYPLTAISLGAVDAYDVESRRALAARGVPGSSVTLLPGKAKDTWDSVHVLRRWLKERPDARLLVLCDRFQSRYYRHVLDAVLLQGDAARVSVRGLPSRYYDETDWWKSRRGVKACLFGCVELAYSYCFGETHPAYEAWDADEYEEKLRQSLQRAAP